MSRIHSVRRSLQQELAPYPGRLSGSLRDTLGVIIALIAAMTLRVPGIAAALALLFLMQRERPSLTMRAGVQMFSAASVACATSLFWVQLTDGSEIGRFVGVVLGIFISAFCMESTTMPAFWTIAGFYGFVNLSAWDAHRGASAIVTSSLYNLAALGLVVASAVFVELLFGSRNPSRQIELELNRRLRDLARFFRVLAGGPAENQQRLRAAHTALLRHLQAGDVHLSELYDRLRDTEDAAQVPLGIQYRIGLLTRVMQRSVPLGFEALRNPTGEHSDAYRVLGWLCTRLRRGEDVTIPEDIPTALRDLFTELAQYARVSVAPDVTESAHRERSWNPFLPDTFRSPDAAFYAMKVTLAAAVCYVLYNAVGWPGIATCVVTVIFTGLNSTGAMKQKQFYRFTGAAIGGALGIAVVSLLYPNMDSITSLVLVVAAVALLSAWIVRCPHIGYVGVQIAFAFSITALSGFSATTKIAPAWERVVGIMLGIVVMWLVFDQFWPRRTSEALAGSLRRIRVATAELAGGSRQFEHLRTAVSRELVNVQQLDQATRFDVGRHHKRELARSRRLIRHIEAAASDFYHTALQS